MRTFRLPPIALVGVLLFVVACSEAPAPPAASFVLHNANIYTVDEAVPRAEAMAIVDGRVALVGTEADVLAAHPDLSKLDAGGRTVLPGLIDAHAHLMNLGIGMLQADLVGADSLGEVLTRLQDFEATLPDSAWLIGRGWDQNDWPVKEFPSRADLDAYFPDRPVWLTRIDGHAAWGNSAAIRVAGEERVRTAPNPRGGLIMRDARGEPTGIFVDAAMDMIEQYQPELLPEQYEQALQLAIGETKRMGLTGVHEAGVTAEIVDLYQRAIDADTFDIRLYAMVGGRGEAFDAYCNQHIMDYGDKLTVRSVKFYMDGALGSRGAALKASYSDDPGNVGLLMQEPVPFAEDVADAAACGYQINTHAIGDRGNEVVLDGYASINEPDGRHRVEHAQVVDVVDIPRFAELGLIASMQPTHATSDMYWAEARVGPIRIRGAYAWRTFLDQGTVVAFGSDFPVERVNPMLGFFASVARQDAEGWPEGGWYPEQRLTREETLRAFTLDAAYAAFQEDQLGSLTPGKHADFVILDRDVMTVPDDDVLATQVIATYIGGEKVYGE